MNDGLKGALCNISTVVGKDGSEVPVEDVVKDKDCIGLYFSAHWCPPCRGFTPVLAEFYKKLMASGESIEIIFVSSDRDEGSFKEYFGEMPWCALPYSAMDKKGELSTKYGVRGIPTFIVLDKNGNVKDANARGSVQANSENPKIPDTWK